MKKDAYYFPHFSNARNDAKILKIRRIIGLEGYAIFFMLLEVLREQSNFKYPLSGIEDLSYEWHVSKEKIYSIITQFDLFQLDEQEFFSTKLIYYMQPYLEKTNRAKVAAEIRWGNARKQALLESNCNADQNANAMQMHMQIESKCNADQNARRGEERRGEERKEEKENIKEKSQFVQNSKEVQCEEIKDLFNQICTNLPRIISLSKQRIIHLKERIKEKTDFKTLFKKVQESDFLCGKIVVSKNNSNFKASFDWIIKSQNNCLKILEGNYDNKKCQNFDELPF